MNQQTGGQQDRQDKNNNENKSNTQIRKYFWPLFGHSPIDTLLWPHLEMFNQLITSSNAVRVAQPSQSPLWPAFAQTTVAHMRKTCNWLCNRNQHREPKVVNHEQLESSSSSIVCCESSISSLAASTVGKKFAISFCLPLSSPFSFSNHLR